MTLAERRRFNVGDTVRTIDIMNNNIHDVYGPYTVEQETTVGQSGSDQSTSVPIIRATLRGRLRA